MDLPVSILFVGRDTSGRLTEAAAISAAEDIELPIITGSPRSAGCPRA
jgi:hypothetical protein